METKNKIEFFKFKVMGESIEGIIVAFIQTQFGASIKLDIGNNDYIYLGINLVGLKDIFKQAVLNKKIIINKTVISLLFKNEVPLKSDSNKTFQHFVLTGYSEKGNKETFFRFSTEEYETINEQDFLELID